MRIRVREQGNFSLLAHYIVDFKGLGRATLATVSLLAGGWVWGLARWGQNTWGGLETITRKISFRNTNNQSIVGQHLALRFSNRRANETFRITGFDIETKAIGKR